MIVLGPRFSNVGAEPGLVQCDPFSVVLFPNSVVLCLQFASVMLMAPFKMAVMSLGENARAGTALKEPCVTNARVTRMTLEVMKTMVVQVRLLLYPSTPPSILHVQSQVPQCLP